MRKILYETIRAVGQGIHSKVYQTEDEPDNKLPILRTNYLGAMNLNTPKTTMISIEMIKKISFTNIMGRVKSFVEETKQRYAPTIECSSGGSLESLIVDHKEKAKRYQKI